MSKEEPYYICRDIRMLKPREGVVIPWFLIATALIEREAISVRNPETGATWLEDISLISGYSHNMLRRMTRAKQFIISLLENDIIEYIEPYANLPLATLDIVNRWCKLDQAAGLAKLEDLIRNPDITYITMLGEYNAFKSATDNASSVKQAGIIDQKKFSHLCFNFARKNPFLISRDQNAKAHFVNNNFVYCRPSFIMTSTAGGREEIDGVICYSFKSKSGSEKITRILESAALASSFFRRFWIILPSSEYFDDLADRCVDLGLTNIGVGLIATGHGDPEISVLLAPSGVQPIDRRHMLPPIDEWVKSPMEEEEDDDPSPADSRACDPVNEPGY
jgi:hypothetical protein